MIGKDRLPKRMPKGSYEELLCFDCEEKFGVFDNYAKEFFLGKDLTPFLRHDDKVYIIDRYDYFKLKSFFLSLLWRASVSSREEFNLIDAGPFESILRNLLLQGSIGSDNDFSIFVTKFDSNEKKIKNIAEKNILFPAKQKIDGLNYSMFYLSGGYKIYIKVDKRNIQNVYEKLALEPNSLMVILRIFDFEETSEFKALINAVQ